MNTYTSNFAFYALFALSLVLVFFIIEKRFEELEMESVYKACIAEENPTTKKLPANNWVDLCKLKIEHEYNRSLHETKDSHTGRYLDLNGPSDSLLPHQQC